MVATQHKPVIGTGEYVERPVSPEIQEELSKADAALPAELRERYPVVARVEIKERYPDHWIALLPTHVDRSNRLVAGRLLAQTKDHREFKRLVESLKTNYPQLHLFTDFTGQYPMGEDVVHV